MDTHPWIVDDFHNLGIQGSRRNRPLIQLITNNEQLTTNNNHQPGPLGPGNKKPQ